MTAAHYAGVGFAALDGPTQKLHVETMRAGMSAALVVEEMARAADPKAFEDHPIERRSPVAAVQWAARRKIATDHAQAIRAAILGEAPESAAATKDPDCPCAACDPGMSLNGEPLPFASRMNVCPDCGNKRCPKAANHATWQCSGSNEVGQIGKPVTP